MIFYFSGTGNSKWVATELGTILGEQVENIVDSQTYSFDKAQIVGIVFPVYAWAPPEIVLKFIDKLSINGAYVFAICTCGDEAGNSMKILSKKLPLHSSFSLDMPNNYIVGADVDSPQIVRKKIETATAKIGDISKQIRIRAKISNVNKGKLAFIKSSVASSGFNKFARSTKPFTVDENCTKCGACVKLCPAKTISFQGGKPVWNKKCYMCLSCINRCPTKAIQYGTATAQRGRYYFGI